MDLFCMDHDGNINDCALLAVIAALKDVRIPTVQLRDTGEIVADRSEEACRSIDFNFTPVASSFGVIDEFLIADPCNEEEELLSSRLTVVLNENGQLCGVYKPGGVGFGKQRFQECIDASRGRSEVLLGLFENVENVE
eukprot:TRINITY_DN2584_c0_g2_i2.p1 TRINITY_DN2584_c0_g2~~TRINITY_DN2584_c0_g2_i2.p1  ORF type:complete len:138 (-),score=17.38 TRINITY_DN2584_c0_g2_i2:24-437(-)